MRLQPESHGWPSLFVGLAGGVQRLAERWFHGDAADRSAWRDASVKYRRNGGG